MLSRLSLLFILLLCTCGRAQANNTEPDPKPVKRITTVQHLGRTHFRIRTSTAIYFYDPVAGGFSSIMDRDGKDWVNYQDKPWGEYPASAASSYRGVPNLVFGGDDDGAGHPGHQKCESRVVAKNQIHTISMSGEWAWTWTFYKDCARLDVEKAPAEKPYWFLYEGPAGGSYQPRTTFWATDLKQPSYVIHDHFKGEVARGQYRYMFFGEDQSRNVFFMFQLTPDTQGDHISYLGNEEIGAADSPDGMVVAGFGRAAGATPLLSGTNSFLIGFQRYAENEKVRVGKVRRGIERLGQRRGKR